MRQMFQVHILEVSRCHQPRLPRFLSSINFQTSGLLRAARRSSDFLPLPGTPHSGPGGGGQHSLAVKHWNQALQLSLHGPREGPGTRTPVLRWFTGQRREGDMTPVSMAPMPGGTRAWLPRWWVAPGGRWGRRAGGCT